MSDDFDPNRKNFKPVKLPNSGGFLDDDRERVEKNFWRKDLCMTNCEQRQAQVTGRARTIDVTPDAKDRPKAV